MGEKDTNLMREIPLSGPYALGRCAIVDDEDYEFLTQWKWLCTKSGYACRFARIGDRKLDKRKQIHMHRLINKTPDGLETDHINRNKLDNRKQNLRSVTKSSNLANQVRKKQPKSGFRGVVWKNYNPRKFPM